MTTIETGQSVERIPNLSGGNWVTGNSQRMENVFNPSTGQLIAEVPLASVEETNSVVQSASNSLEAWSETPVVERARIMFKLRQLMEDRFNDIAALVTREHGKTLAESRAEVQRALEMVEFSCGIPSMIVGDTMPNIARDVDAETNRHPVGVCVGITPYNFPSMVPMWMIPVALVCGNTFVLKPSEKTPLSANLIGELLIEAGLPAGVFNICLLYTSPSPRDLSTSRMPSSA